MMAKLIRRRSAHRHNFPDKEIFKNIYLAFFAQEILLLHNYHTVYIYIHI